MSGGIVVSVCDDAFKIQLKLFGDATQDGITKALPYSLPPSRLLPYLQLFITTIHNV